MDARYFQRAKVHELKIDLNNAKRDGKSGKRKNVLRRIIANMTMGNDMSSLYTEVIAIGATVPTIEIKRLVFLFVSNYSRSKAELAAAAIHMLSKDCQDSSPVVRGLALRTLSSISHVKDYETMATCVRNGSKDSDPFVRKIAAMGIAKLHFLDASLWEQTGLVSECFRLLTDDNMEVASNAAVALKEIAEIRGSLPRDLGMHQVLHLAEMLGDCPEWSQIAAMELMLYRVPQSSTEALKLLENTYPRLSHSNGAVKLTAIRLILFLLNFLDGEEEKKAILKRLTPPLVALLASAPEVQYTALKSAIAVVQKYPEMMKSDIQLMFCKYDDPRFVKMAKLEMMMRLLDETNIEIVLSELHEYASEPDKEFVKRAISCIGTCAVVISARARDCVDVLVALLRTKIAHVAQQVLIVMKDVLRAAPEHSEHVEELCEYSGYAVDSESRAAVAWIVGEFSSSISGARGLLEEFLDEMADDSSIVQLTVLTACVKVALSQPTEGNDLVGRALKWATQEAEDPDVRERGVMYWRLLTNDPVSAKEIIMGHRPSVSVKSRQSADMATIDRWLIRLGTVSGVIQGTDKPAAVDSSLAGLDYAAARGVEHQVDHLTDLSHPRTTWDGQQKESLLSVFDRDPQVQLPGKNSYQPNDLLNFGSAENNASPVPVLGRDSAAGQPVTAAVGDALNARGADVGSYAGRLPPVVAHSNEFQGLVHGCGDAQPGHDTSLHDGWFLVSPVQTNQPVSGEGTGVRQLETKTSTSSLANSTPVASHLAGVAESTRAPLSVTPSSNQGDLLQSKSSLHEPTTDEPHSILKSELASLTADQFSFMTLQNPLILPKELWLNSQQGKGLEIRGMFVRRRRRIIMEMTFTNRALQSLSDFAFQFNKNTHGFKPSTDVALRQLAPNTSEDVKLSVEIDDALKQPTDPYNNLQVAVKTNAGISYFQTQYPMYICFSEDGFSFPKSEFLRIWKDIPDVRQGPVSVEGMHFDSSREIIEHLMAHGIFCVAERTVEGQVVMYLVSVTMNGDKFLMEFRPSSDLTKAVLFVKSYRTEALPLLAETMVLVLKRVQRPEPVMRLDPNQVQATGVAYPHRLDQHMMMQYHGPSAQQQPGSGFPNHSILQHGGTVGGGLSYQAVDGEGQWHPAPQPTILLQMQRQNQDFPLPQLQQQPLQHPGVQQAPAFQPVPAGSGQPLTPQIPQAQPQGQAPHQQQNSQLFSSLMNLQQQPQQ